MQEDYPRLRYPSGIPRPGRKPPDGHNQNKRRTRDGPAWKWFDRIHRLLRWADNIPADWIDEFISSVASAWFQVDPEAIKSSIRVLRITFTCLDSFFRTIR